jgi:hypothetical protein
MADMYIHRMYDPNSESFVRWTADAYDPAGDSYDGAPAFNTLTDLVLERVIVDPDPQQVVVGGDGRPGDVNSAQVTFLSGKLKQRRYPVAELDLHVPELDRPDNFSLHPRVVGDNEPLWGYNEVNGFDGGNEMHVPDLDRPDNYELAPDYTAQG